MNKETFKLPFFGKSQPRLGIKFNIFKTNTGKTRKLFIKPSITSVMREIFRKNLLKNTHPLSFRISWILGKITHIPKRKILEKH
ncbi:hypothetical protein A3730_28540 [Alcanivorax sp. HI0044]|nr:hypothetical protein A3730_28540 [Alcanivorax sp. HI0044]